MEDENETLSLRHRRKKSAIANISCCFSKTSDLFDNFSSSSPLPSSSLRSPSSWFKSSKSRSQESTDAKGAKRRSRSHNIISRMGRHRRHASADFSYDPLSYSLNFEDEGGENDQADSPVKNFSARLPVSPPRTRKLEDLAVKMEAMELRRKGGSGDNDEKQAVMTPPMENVGGRGRRNNVFEVRVPRNKADPSTRNPESLSPLGSRPERDILVETVR